jgi:hypothetical protein
MFWDEEDRVYTQDTSDMFTKVYVEVEEYCEIEHNASHATIISFT